MRLAEWLRDVVILVSIAAVVYVCLPGPTKQVPPGCKTKMTDIPVHRFETLTWNLYYFLLLLEEDYGGSLAKDSVTQI